MSDGVPVACLDHGGSGPDLVLMHGAGMEQRSLEPLVGHLTGAHRVVTFDFRGHGRTPGSAWSVDSAVADLEAVIDALDLRAPAVGGHSLGGMVAVEYARRHPECPAAVNLDGHGMGSPEQYVGKDPDRAARWIADQRARSTRIVQGRLVKGLAALARLRGTSSPSAAALVDINEAVARLDLTALYREVTVPLLVVSAPAAATGLAARLMRDPDGMAAAYRAGLRRDLAALAAERPHLRPVELDAGHLLVRTHPAETAAVVADFLRTAR